MLMGVTPASAYCGLLGQSLRMLAGPLLVIASGLYRLMAKRMRGYADAQARQIFRDLIDTPADVAVTQEEIVVSFHRRAHLPIILASGLLDGSQAHPWCCSWHARCSQRGHFFGFVAPHPDLALVLPRLREVVRHL
jgi:hypothetical protein